jgi:hypothetical protein
VSGYDASHGNLQVGKGGFPPQSLYTFEKK